MWLEECELIIESFLFSSNWLAFPHFLLLRHLPCLRFSLRWICIWSEVDNGSSLIRSCLGWMENGSLGNNLLLSGCFSSILLLLRENASSLLPISCVCRWTGSPNEVCDKLNDRSVECFRSRSTFERVVELCPTRSLCERIERRLWIEFGQATTYYRVGGEESGQWTLAVDGTDVALDYA